MYDRIAHFYDLTHADLTDDLPFILALAEKTGGSILELGCGSGRILLPLAQAGHRVTGVDNSGEMLSRAGTQIVRLPAAVQQHITLIQADMASFTIENGRFSLIIIPYNTFLHLNNNQAISALQQIRQHLAKNGTIFIDLINPFAIADTPDTPDFTFEGQFTDPTNNNTILQFAANRLDEATQTLHITWAYDVSTSSGSPTQRTIVESTYHYRFPHQLDLLLQQTGLQLTALFGNYDHSPFTEESDRLLILAQH